MGGSKSAAPEAYSRSADVTPAIHSPEDPLSWISPPLRQYARPIADLREDPDNARRHPEYNLAAIRRSLERFGQQKPIIQDLGGVVRAGNGTLAAARSLGRTMIASIASDLSPEEIAAYALADNRAGELSEWDPEKLKAALGDLPEGLRADAGWSESALKVAMGLSRPPDPRASLAERFGVPPFSVLDARQGYWRSRKAHWLAMGIQSELGRGAGAFPDAESSGGPLDRRESIRDLGDARRLSPGGSPRPAAKLGANGRTVRGDGRGRAMGSGS